MLSLNNKWQFCLYLPVDFLIEVEHELPVKLCPQFAQFLESCLTDMYFVITATVTVDDSVGIHARRCILKFRIFHQQIIKPLTYHLLVKVNIAFSQKFSKEPVDIHAALLCHLDDIFCSNRKRTLLPSVKLTIDFSNQLIGKVLLREVHNVVEHKGGIADAIAGTVNRQTQPTSHLLQLTYF